MRAVYPADTPASAEHPPGAPRLTPPGPCRPTRGREARQPGGTAASKRRPPGVAERQSSQPRGLARPPNLPRPDVLEETIKELRADHPWRGCASVALEESFIRFVRSFPSTNA